MRRAEIYLKQESSVELWQKQYWARYSMAIHRRVYNTIRHIQVKQHAYLGEGKNEDA